MKTSTALTSNQNNAVKFTTFASNVKKIALVFLLMALSIAPFATISAKCNDAKSNARITTSVVSTTSAEALKTNMQELWKNYAILTHNVALCLVDGQAGEDDVVTQLTKNQADIADIISIYYGDDAGKKFRKLFHKDITIAADVMIATRNDRKTHYLSTLTKWNHSVAEMITFLDQFDLNLNITPMQATMNKLTQCTFDQILALKNKDYEGCEKAYSGALSATSEIADLFTDGIIKQFPEEFTAPKTITVSPGIVSQK